MTPGGYFRPLGFFQRYVCKLGLKGSPCRGTGRKAVRSKGMLEVAPIARQLGGGHLAKRIRSRRLRLGVYWAHRGVPAARMAAVMASGESTWMLDTCSPLRLAHHV